MDKIKNLEQQYVTELIHALQAKYLTRYTKVSKKSVALGKSPIEKLFILGFIRFCEEDAIRCYNYIDLKSEYRAFDFRESIGKRNLYSLFEHYISEITLLLDSTNTFLRGDRFLLISQFEIDRYKADFLLIHQRFDYGNIQCAQVIIECDGHEFHEKTKGQAQHDKERDRCIQKHGYHILRFTGAEIYSDPLKVVIESIEFLKTTTPCYSYKGISHKT